MRRAGILLLALAVLSAAGIAAAGTAVNAARDQVEYTETVLLGDPAAARGLTIRERAHYDDRLFWDTLLRPGAEAAPETAYRFYQSGHYVRTTREPSGADLYCGPDVTFDTGDRSAALPGTIAAAYWELFDATALGEEGSATLLLRDYYDVYPVSFEVDLPGYTWSSSFGDDVCPPDSLERRLTDAFQSFFRIPVLEDETLEIHLRKSSEDEITSWGYGSGSTGDSFSLWAEGVAAADGAYFTFDCHTYEDDLADTSLIPGGYGIYRLPYSLDADGAAVPDPEGLAMVYPLDPSVRLLDLTLSRDGERLLLQTQEEGRFVLTVIELSTLDTLQRLELDWGEESWGYWLYPGDGFLVLLLSGDRILVLDELENGCYEQVFSTPYPNFDELGIDLWWSTGATVMDYDCEEGRLAILWFSEDPDYYFSSCDLMLLVLDGGGTAYLGRYGSSLSAGGLPDTYQSYCQPQVHDPLSVQWD